MSLKKDGVVVACEQCEYASNDKRDSFDVIVPLSDTETGLHGIARLRCTVSPSTHQVELNEWKGATGEPVQTSAVMNKRVRGALSFIADHRVCGNQHICPSQVVEIVEKRSRT